MAEQTEQLKEKISGEGSDGGSPLSGVTDKSNLVPALATAAAAAAAGLAATKGPDLLKKLTGQAGEEAEELGSKAAEGAKEQIGSGGGGVMGKAASKLMGGGGGGGQKGGKTRRLPIQRWTDVAVPVERAYEAWTQFEEFPKFMHRVLEVKPDDGDEGDKIHWREKIWFSTREWDGEIVERRKNDRIAWKSVSGTQHSGVISFHKLDDNLTRVMVEMDFVPSGILEKMASGLRFVKRAVQADLARYKAYVEFGQIDGLEYKSTPAEMEQNEDDDSGDDEQQNESDGQEAQGSSDDSSDDDSSGEDREQGRQEREKRREERQKSLSAS